MRDLLVVGQIATTLLLLVGASVLMRSFLAVRQVTPGFNPEIDPQQPIYDTRPLDAVVDRSLGHRRFQMMLHGCVLRSGAPGGQGGAVDRAAERVNGRYEAARRLGATREPVIP